ncbi:uba ts-n domain-containing protein [Ophiostoma piceae UAMH 11346]|uniref:Uba ts-n domain-containing protein n=1 Tax=Ophiostoma piceae (strain UAMH 11346) TaxID=1262450 RepID=S3D2X3_OPHP1|nr:uba ts-n domain-containing protein [Ophiostoma piceae UAMH 11346]
MAPGDSGESLNLSPEERHVYGQLFRQADPDNVGIVMGEAAVKFFEKTRLNARLLGEVWQIADRENRGFLTPAGFSVALRLIGHAQANKEPTATLALSQGPIPQFEGVTTTPLNPQPTAALSPQGTGAGAPQLSAQGSGAPRVPPLPLERAAQYARVFQDQAHGDTVLSGEASKRIFEKSGLGVDVLGRIWQLADTEQRGALVQTEFIIAMHLLTSIKAGTLRSLPTILPAGLYDAATRGSSGAAGGSVPPVPGPNSPVSGQRSPLGASFGAGGIAPPPAVARQMTGMRPPPPNFSNSPMARAAAAPAPTHAPAGGPEWLITPAEKARMSTVFQDLDKLKKGVLTGEQAVPFLQRSGLDDNILAQIWDLADVKSEGQLTSDTFAVALYLIQQQRQTGSPLPDKLPLNLIPPSMRTAQQQRPTSPPVAAPIAAPVAAPPPHIKSAMDDLFDLDSGPSSTTPSLPALTATPTGAGAGVPPPSDPFASSTSPVQPSSPTRSPINNTSAFKPFVPSSAFGRTLTTQVTGDSNKSAPGAASQVRAVPTPPQTFGISAPPAPAAAQSDLLGGDDGEASRSLSNDTAELANLSNQIGSLSKHMQETSANRSNLQNELSQTSVQKKNFEQRLAQLRALYEKEARDVRALEDQLKTSKAETTKLQAEVATIEASYYDLQSQHQTITAALHADQQENASLKERLKVVSAEVNQVKPQIEKLKSEARQQKGIVAINRKQLSLGESERDKLKVEAEDLTRQNQDLARQIQNASVVSSAGSAAASPSVASASGKNPFFRRTGSSDIMGVFSNPSPSSTPLPPKSYADKSFDDVFGPSPTAASPAPSASAIPAAVKPQFTGASTASSTFSAVTAPTSEAAAPATSRQATFSPETAAPAAHESALSPFSPSASSEAGTEVPTISGAFPTSADVASPAASVTAPSAAASPAPAAAAVHAAPPATSTKDVADEAAPSSALGAFGLPAAAAAVTAAAAGVAAAVIGTNETASPAANADEEKSVWAQGHGKNDSLADPFSTLDDNKDKAKEDFESAFASFKAARAGESSSGDGFDDAFEVKTPASGTAATSTFAPIKSEDTAGVETDKAFTDFDTEFPPIAELNHEDSDSESDNGGFDDDFAPASPPSNKDHKTAPAAAEASLPAAVEANSHSNAESATPKAASPELAKSAPADTDIFNAPAAPSNMDDIFSAPAAAAPAAAAASTATTSFDNTSFDDLDDFDGLEEAREGSGDEEFANISRSGLDDFQSAFNSSPAGKGIDSGFDFSSLGGASSSVAGVASGSTNKAAGDSSDWFSLGADEQKPVATAAATAPAAPADAADAARPSASRNATQESATTDDPTLQRLTSMGYPRATALSALEKYDYNVERAANFLASQS